MTGTNNNNTQGNCSRQFEADIVKFIAIPFMICIHFYEQFGSYDFAHVMPDTMFRNIVEFLGGPLAAPVFMFCMGIGMTYTRHDSPADFMKRGLRLLATGYALNFFRQTLPQLIGLVLGIDPGLDIIGGLLCVDILPFAGASFIIVGLMKKAKISSLTMLAVSVLMQAVGIWSATLTFKQGIFQNLLGLLIPTGKWTSFPLTLWLVYPVCGIIFAEYLRKTKDKHRLYSRIMIISLSAFTAYTSCLIFSGYDIRKIYALCNDLYYHNTFMDTLWILPLVLIELSVCHFVFHSLEQTRLGDIIRYFSINLNVIYIIQWLIIAYSVAISFVMEPEKTESPLLICVGGISVFIISTRISKLVLLWKNKS